MAILFHSQLCSMSIFVCFTFLSACATEFLAALSLLLLMMVKFCRTEDSICAKLMFHYHRFLFCSIDCMSTKSTWAWDAYSMDKTGCTVIPLHIGLFFFHGIAHRSLWRDSEHQFIMLACFWLRFFFHLIPTTMTTCSVCHMIDAESVLSGCTYWESFGSSFFCKSLSLFPHCMTYPHWR